MEFVHFLPSEAKSPSSPPCNALVSTHVLDLGTPPPLLPFHHTPLSLASFPTPFPCQSGFVEVVGRGGATTLRLSGGSHPNAEAADVARGSPGYGWCCGSA